MSWIASNAGQITISRWRENNQGANQRDVCYVPLARESDSWCLEDDPNQLAYIAARTLSRFRIPGVLVDGSQGQVVVRRRACSVAWSLTAQGIRLALVHSHTDMDRKYCNQKLVVSQLECQRVARTPHFCLILTSRT